MSLIQQQSRQFKQVPCLHAQHPSSGTLLLAESTFQAAEMGFSHVIGLPYCQFLDILHNHFRASMSPVNAF
jgi:hypothetical protein